MTKPVKFVMAFGRNGVDPTVVQDMMRYDGMALIDWRFNIDGRFIWIEFVTRHGSELNEPTMARWGSFMVGARVVSKALL